MGYLLLVKWRFITSPDVAETEDGFVPDCGPDEVPEDMYHPDKLIHVGPVFEEMQAASEYARDRGWSADDIDIRPVCP
jgi:hypothetical protein